VQTGNVHWGFHIRSLFGTSYRFTANKGLFQPAIAGTKIVSTGSILCWSTSTCTSRK
jgi:hypothetical protein